MSGAVEARGGLAGQKHTLFTRDLQARFCEQLSICGNVRSAARSVGVSRANVYRLKRACPQFEAMWHGALVLARAEAEEVLADRAINGVEEQVFYHGEEVATRRRYDGRLLLAHLARLDRLAEDRQAEEAAMFFDEGLDELRHAGEALAPRERPVDEDEDGFADGYGDGFDLDAMAEAFAEGLGPDADEAVHADVGEAGAAGEPSDADGGAAEPEDAGDDGEGALPRSGGVSSLDWRDFRDDGSGAGGGSAGSSGDGDLAHASAGEDFGLRTVSSVSSLPGKEAASGAAALEGAS